MAEQQDPIGAALRRLRASMRDQVPAPAGAAVRARADRQQRVRRTGVAVLAAAAVAAVAIGGAQLLPQASAPVPPADTPSPTQPLTQSPSPTGPPPLPDVTPSPRPAPQSPRGVDDPIADVDWYQAAVTLPPSEYCPSGTVQFQRFEGDARVHADGRVIEIYPDAPDLLPRPAYGDVTGDGRLEVLIETQCFLSADGTDQTSGHGGQVLAVARADDGTLTGLGWVGPRGASISSVWVADGRVLMVGDPWTADPEDHFPAVPGLALSYRWDGARFTGWEPAAEYPPIVPVEPDATRPVVRPRAVADGLACATDDLRFGEEPNGGVWTATGGGATYAIVGQPFQQYLFDLDNTGERLLVTALECVRDEVTATGLAVFEPAGDGWQGISVLRHPAGHSPAIWYYGDGVMRVEWSTGDDEEPLITEHRWNGTVFDPVTAG